MCCASPASKIAAAAEVMSIPNDLPNSCLLGTNANAAPCSSHRIGRWTTSGGSTSSAIISLLVPRSIAFVASLVPFLTLPLVELSNGLQDWIYEVLWRLKFNIICFSHTSSPQGSFSIPFILRFGFKSVIWRWLLLFFDVFGHHLVKFVLTFSLCIDSNYWFSTTWTDHTQFFSSSVILMPSVVSESGYSSFRAEISFGTFSAEHATLSFVV